MDIVVRNERVVFVFDTFRSRLDRAQTEVRLFIFFAVRVVFVFRVTSRASAGGILSAGRNPVETNVDTFAIVFPDYTTELRRGHLKTLDISTSYMYNTTHMKWR